MSKSRMMLITIHDSWLSFYLLISCHDESVVDGGAGAQMLCQHALGDEESGQEARLVSLKLVRGGLGAVEVDARQRGQLFTEITKAHADVRVIGRQDQFALAESPRRHQESVQHGCGGDELV